MKVDSELAACSQVLSSLSELDASLFALFGAKEALTAVSLPCFRRGVDVNVYTSGCPVYEGAAGLND